jgi:molybdopterin molybdotransferase
MPNLLSVVDAVARITARAARLPHEMVDLHAAAGRTLAVEVASDHDLPPFDNSAMDGYAVHAADLLGATPDLPVALDADATILAGHGEAPPLPPGRAMRIMTGAPLPAGADAVVPIERTARDDAGHVLFIGPATVGANRRPRGSDLPRGTKVLHAGALLRPAELCLLAALGWAAVPCVRRPRTVVLSTGDEVVPVDTTPGPGQIRDSSLIAMPAQLAASGAEVVRRQHVPDSPEELERVLGDLGEVDLIVTMGGVSVGDRDYVRPVFERLGERVFWQVAIKPGKPLVFGLLGEALFFGLPGNPVSGMVCLEVFVRPAIDSLLGRQGGRIVLAGRWAAAVCSDARRTEFVRVHAAPAEDGVWEARPTGEQSSGRMMSMLGANAFGVIGAGVGAVAEGDAARIELFEPPVGSVA